MRIILTLILIIGLAWMFGLLNVHIVQPMMGVDHLISEDTLKTIPLEEQSKIYRKLKGIYEPSIFPMIGAVCLVVLSATALYLDVRNRKLNV